MELRQLKHFVLLAEELNFSRAAERCHLTQPSLTRQIQLLEQELNIQLFDRSKRQIQLTEAGRVLLQGARRVLREVERSLQEVQQFAGKAQRLRVGFTQYSLYGRLPRILDCFQANSQVQLELHELFSPDQLRGLEEGWLDVGFLWLPRPPNSLLHQLIERIELFLLLPDKHPLATLAEVPFQALKQERFVVMGRHVGAHVSSAYTELLVGWCRQAGFDPTIADNEGWVASDAATIRLVASGAGVHLCLPSEHTRARALPAQVVRRRLVDPTPYLELTMAWPVARETPSVRQLLDCATTLSAPAIADPRSISPQGIPCEENRLYEGLHNEGRP